MADSLNYTPSSELLEAFRYHYRRFEASVQETVLNSGDDTAILWRLGDDLDQFIRLIQEVSLDITVYILFLG